MFDEARRFSFYSKLFTDKFCLYPNKSWFEEQLLKGLGQEYSSIKNQILNIFVDMHTKSDLGRYEKYPELQNLLEAANE